MSASSTTSVLKSWFIHGGLFLLTFITTTLAGSFWTKGSYIENGTYSWSDFMDGLPYSLSLLSILAVHEFGHYFVAVWHRVKSSLPYFIPLYFPGAPFSIGTMGAIIRLRSRPYSNVQHFDIGLAGPLAGFLLAIAILVYGFTHLPGLEYIFSIHPEYADYGKDYAQYVYESGFYGEGVPNVVVGNNLLFMFFERFVADPALLPNQYEIIHYPLLFAGFISLVVTSINLLPIGQLDGGHILYGLVGYTKHLQIARILFLIFLFYAGLGYLSPFEDQTTLLWQIPLMMGFYWLALSRMGLPLLSTIMLAVAMVAVQMTFSRFFPQVQGYSGWLLFALIIGRFVGIAHPRCLVEVPLTPLRKVMGWIALVIFILCFSPNPIDFVF